MAFFNTGENIMYETLYHDLESSSFAMRRYEFTVGKRVAGVPSMLYILLVSIEKKHWPALAKTWLLQLEPCIASSMMESSRG